MIEKTRRFCTHSADYATASLPSSPATARVLYSKQHSKQHDRAALGHKTEFLSHDAFDIQVVHEFVEKG
jgi:hypothetical protein